jgi:hypothetical protein
MMGANWRSDPQHSYEKKFAWMPIKSATGKTIWLEDYYIRLTYYDHNGKPPVKGQYFSPYVYTKHEFLMARLKGA